MVTVGGVALFFFIPLRYKSVRLPVVVFVAKPPSHIISVDKESRAKGLLRSTGASEVRGTARHLQYRQVCGLSGAGEGAGLGRGK